MNERIVQALLRFIVSGVIAAIAFFVANATVLNGILVDAGADPIYAGIITSLFIAVLNSITKYIGGATEPAPVTHGVGAAPARRPNILSI